MKPKYLKFMGGVTRDPGDYFLGVPPRDLTEDDIAQLDDATLANITGTPPFADGSPYSGPLYKADKPPEKIKAEKPQTETGGAAT